MSKKYHFTIAFVEKVLEAFKNEKEDKPITKDKIEPFINGIFYVCAV